MLCVRNKCWSRVITNALAHKEFHFEEALANIVSDVILYFGIRSGGVRRTDIPPKSDEADLSHITGPRR
jgi:hypothetical protein